MKKKEFLKALQLCGNDIIAIDGPSGSGKTTLASEIANMYNVDIVHMDDFFLPIDLRTKERLNECGGNVHYERFLDEVGNGIQSRGEFCYRKFSCKTMSYESKIRISYKKPIIVEGSYSLRADFRGLYTKMLYLEVDEETQKQRIIKRVGIERYEDFKNIWIPKEKEYIEKFQIKKSADIILEG